MSAVTFDTICKRLRFSLDQPLALAERQAARSTADFLAKVRSNGLQVTRTTVPKIWGSIERVCKKLHLNADVSAYIIHDPSANAFVPSGQGGERPVIVLTSGLVTLLDVNELSFAIGHEIGHYGFMHAQQEPADGKESFLDVLHRRSEQRHAEISADRMALLSTGSVFVAARVMIKIASGLPAEYLGLDIDSFIQQADRDPDELNRLWELDTTHPSLPLRLWALLQYAHTDAYLSLSGQGVGGLPAQSVEQMIERRMRSLGDGVLHGIEEKSYEFAITWATTSLVIESGRVDRRSQEALGTLLGPTRAKSALEFARVNGRTAVQQKLQTALQRIKGCPAPVQQRFMESLVMFAGVDLNAYREGETMRAVRLMLES